MTLIPLDAELPALRQRLMRQARMALADAAQAEDLVQDTLIAVLEQHGERRGDSTLATWATSILRHKVADWYRSPARTRQVALAATDDSDPLAHDIDALYDETGHYREQIPVWQQPDGQTERKQLKATLDGCLSCLPTQTRRVFMMREWLGFDTDEICQRLSISADNCRTILHRARMSLRECMQHRWPDDRRATGVAAR
ncbi:MAG: sigma-70 family RNA polymerase sigma factor [Aquincola sp.]|nr:sigma-70 family RNA polymerase sigma factor [Aquincola sp.]MDH5330515.1 sigma-70 family RNA polymerase sigma factor [Aquincola sp.]